MYWSAGEGGQGRKVGNAGKGGDAGKGGEGGDAMQEKEGREGGELRGERCLVDYSLMKLTVTLSMKMIKNTVNDCGS